MFRRITCFFFIITLGILPRFCNTMQAVNCLTFKHYTRRSDSRQKPLQLVGDYHYTHRYDTDSWYGLLSITPTYRASFRSELITDCLLGSERCIDRCGNCTEIQVQGSAIGEVKDGYVISKRSSKAWLADYFYLPRNYDSSFTMKPSIKTFSVMIDAYLGSSCGAYLRLFGPIAHSRWNLRFRESTMGFSGCCDPNTLCYANSDGNCTYEPMNHSCGYFSQSEYEGTKLVRTFRDFMCGAVPETSEGNTIKWNPLKYGKMTCHARSETGLADLRMELGWNFINCIDYRLGMNIQAAAPTGKKKKPCYLFDAMVGNGNHWEFGGGLSGHYRLWEDNTGKLSLDFIFDVNVTHMFKSRQCRTFDLKCKANGAYMLAAKFETNETRAIPPLAQDATDFQVGRSTENHIAPDVATDIGVSEPSPNKQFALEYTPVANLSTINVDVSVGAHVDIVGMLHYRCGKINWDVGYNFWARSCEKIKCPRSNCNRGTLCDPANKDIWALKGDARMFGFQAVTIDDIQSTPLLKTVPLSATQSFATIYNGTNQVLPENLLENSPTNAAGKDINLNVDDVEFAYALTPIDANNASAPLTFNCNDEFNVPSTNNAYCNLVNLNHQIKTSGAPAFLSCESINLARSRGISHTVFSHLSYDFEGGDYWTPYIGIGASIEFGNSSDTCCDMALCCTSCCNQNCSAGSVDCCNTCLDCAVSQWSIWLKGGLAYS